MASEAGSGTGRLGFMCLCVSILEFAGLGSGKVGSSRVASRFNNKILRESDVCRERVVVFWCR